jgi:2,3-bisphosphoglycerate-independent phosphoglycerate mutase
MAEAVREAYKRGEDDEAMEPIVLVDNTGKPIGRINNQDYVIFYNIRGEREIQLTQAFVDEKFDKFKRKDGMHVNFVTMIEYDKSLNVRVAFPPMSKIQNTLCEVISKNGLTQVKIVESEKAVHMTYYLNGKNDDIFPNEERIIIPSLKGIEFFDKKPEMNISKVTEVIIEKINDDKYDFIFANLANTDVVGHIENEAAIKKAVEVVDMHTGMIVDTAQKKGIITIVTADHGTVEKWLYPDGTIDTGHTDSPVPFILIIPDNRVNYTLRSDGELADIAPTILTLAGLDIPNDMTGRSLIVEPLQYSRRRMLILILDGWGVRDDATGNLIAQANTPVMDKLKHMYPYVTLKAAGEAVGLPAGSVGNSEVGHLHIGAGRRVNSDKVRINQALHDGSYFNNKAFLWAINGVKQAGTQLHLLGIVSFFSSHGSIDYLLALLKMAKKYNVDNVYIHSLLGRRGERPENGARYIEKIERETEELNIGRVVSVIGRHWALDREQHWDRIEKTYRMLVFGDGRAVKTG